ncbi:MAG: bifunctional phosphopantothenoylcysteine decarboxylase/phosphopantothenate--cysteine ligase CoaBC [Bacteroidales bacterium]|jgi:phosphopantothenoylcysteine decarboxylase/phosphopantothenate--cysteine ligase|nr:bifunctional phosphopantothenoylcysteine decarboxylase/phosphopantothenate--cysteine ligase CoaBC [Bacteroidales bacterium]
MLKGKNILVGVTGGIAAYKTATIIRLLVKEGAEVKVIMTNHAREFITPLTLSTLSKNPVLSEFYNPDNGDWNSHVDLGLWADLYLIAPATANSIAKMAAGIADNLLLTAYLSARCPVFVAPSMDVDMLNHPAAIINIETLKAFGNIILEPPSGELASGLTGKGRMTEPEDIVKEIRNFFSKKKTGKPLKGRKILINAGPTREQLDPVRFISNYSSGKMGIALADTAADFGAEVELVLGPADILPKNRTVKIINVTTAQSMADECILRFPTCDAAILSAAVADYTAEKTEPAKMKKNDKGLTLRLKPTTDIAAELGKMKKPTQILVGFALETDNEVKNATGKLKRKNLDFIVLNSLSDSGSGFGHNTNRITIIDKFNNIDKFELKSKQEAAGDILKKIVSMIK